MTESGDSSLQQYKQQLTAVEESLNHVQDDQRGELLDLRNKLVEVIALLEGCEDEKGGTNNQQEVQEDDEFSRFQMEIKQLEAKSESPSTETIECNDVHEEIYKVLSAMEGNKCRAPFIREWGEKAYHNALIFSTDLYGQDVSDLNDVQVKVMFCNPMCDKMKPCPYFLDGHCKFQDDKCRFSHGYSVKFAELDEYVLPDYSDVQRDSRCLAKYRDGLWHMAIIEKCLDDHKYIVKYDKLGKLGTLPAHEILPIEGLSMSDSDDDDSSSSSSESTSGDVLVQNDVPTDFGYAAEVGTSALGSWEQHTKGIASKLMAKMGYVWGQGLGKNSDGRIDPVEAVVLPKGKSLDKCAEIREFNGPVSVEEKFNAEQAKEQRRVEKINMNEKKSEATVFDFINKAVFKSGDSKQEQRKAQPASDSLKSSSNQSLNVKMVSVGEDIKKTKKEINRMQEFLMRNTERNEAACKVMKQKMATQKTLLRSLEAKEQRINSEINLRKNDKKITVF